MDGEMTDLEQGIADLCNDKGWRMTVTEVEGERWLTVTLGDGVYIEAGNAGTLVFWLNKLY